MKNSLIIKKIFEIFILLIIATVFLLFFSDTTSPLTGTYYYGSDSGFYLLAGMIMKNGGLVYKDIFDQKGPYFFLIEELSQYIAYGKPGIFILQIINLTLTLFFADKIIGLLVKKELKIRILYLIPVLWIFAGTIDGGNMTEEFSLPLLMISLYLFINYIRNNDNYYHKPIIALIYGMFFSFFLFSRINNAALLCSVVFTVIITLIINKQYLNLFHNAIFFIIGFSIMTLPIILYYYSKGLLSDMLYAMFEFGFSYATNYSIKVRLKNYFSFINITYLFIAFLPVVLLKLSKNKNIYLTIFSITAFISTFIATFIGYCLLHYFTIVVPITVFDIYIFIENNKILIPIFKKWYITAIVVIILAVQMYSTGLHAIYSGLHIVDYNRTYNTLGYYKQITQASKDAIEHIPEKERDSVFGYDIRSIFYLRANILPCTKYYDFIDMNYEVYYDGVEKILNSGEAKWYIRKIYEDRTTKVIDKWLQENYEENYRNKYFIIYRYNN